MFVFICTFFFCIVFIDSSVPAYPIACQYGHVSASVWPLSVSIPFLPVRLCLVSVPLQFISHLSICVSV